MKTIIFIALFALSCAYIYAQPTDPKKVVDRDYNVAFMPGGGYSFFVPKAQDSLGILSGGVIEFLLFGKVAQNDDFGPSHVRLYGKLNILKSSKKNVTDFFFYGIGLDMSIERNPKRDFLIPYFGLEMGGLSNKIFGTTLQFTPTVGVHLLSKKNIFLNVQAGYMYPINNFEMLRGTAIQAGLNFSLW